MYTATAFIVDLLAIWLESRPLCRLVRTVAARYPGMLPVTTVTVLPVLLEKMYASKVVCRQVVLHLELFS